MSRPDFRLNTAPLTCFSWRRSLRGRCWSLLVRTALGVMGRLGLVNQTTSNTRALTDVRRWQLLLVLSIPDHAESMLLPLLAAYWVSSELVGQRWLNATPSLHGKASVRLDAEGRQRTIMLVDCACDGANTHYGHASVEGCSTVSAPPCTQPLSRMNLLEHKRKPNNRCDDHGVRHQGMPQVPSIIRNVERSVSRVEPHEPSESSGPPPPPEP